MMNRQAKQQAMSALAAEIDALSESPLFDFRKKQGYQAVVGEGSLDAPVVFIGEAPGKKEAETGRPFVGASGTILAELLQTIGLAREDVYITNVVKDRPPENRDPRQSEIAHYAPFLERQLEIIKPQVVATLGRFAMAFIIDHFNLPLQGEKISSLHGTPIAIQGNEGALTFIPLYHPAVALYNRNRRGTLEADFEVLRRYI
jgi:uracil-DNA glycosylase